MLCASNRRTDHFDAEEKRGREGICVGNVGFRSEPAVDSGACSSVSSAKLPVVRGDAAVSLEVWSVSGADGGTCGRDSPLDCCQMLPAREGYPGTWPGLWIGSWRNRGHAVGRAEHDCRGSVGADRADGPVPGGRSQCADGRGGADFCHGIPHWRSTACPVRGAGRQGVQVLGSGSGAAYRAGCGSGNSARNIRSGSNGAGAVCRSTGWTDVGAWDMVLSKRMKGRAAVY